MKKHAFRPTSLDGLEPRLVMSAAAARVPAAVVTPPAEPGSVVHGLSRPTGNRETSRFETNWMRGMIGHHGMAIQMARLALTNSSSPEVLSLARGIIRAQTREIRQMQGWLSGWYGVRGVRPRMTADDMHMLHELGSLRGAEFDRAFLTEMIGHHQQAVRDAEELLMNAVHRPLRRLGTNIIATQTAEIAEMQSLLGHAGGDPVAGHGG